MKTSQREKRKSESKKKVKKVTADGKPDTLVRIEHLNYKVRPVFHYCRCTF